MPSLFRRHSSVVCFFCQSPSNLPHNPLAFRCLTCGCWNRYDDNGEIISEEPAMHAESLNTNSFAMRASTSRDQLPTMYGPGPFCHTCQSNQLLIVNLMSNFLPHPNDPEYPARLASLKEYRESLHARYPPVCDNCSPAVEDQIRQKDHMARTKALGSWLNDSKGKERQRRVSEGYREPEKATTEIIVWRLRGCLWAITFISAFICNLAGALAIQPPYTSTRFHPILPGIVFLSLLWTVWDPTYSSMQRAKRQGRDVRVRGKDRYIKMQMMAWLSRLVTSFLYAWAWHKPDWNSPISSPSSNRSYFIFSLLLELTTFIISCRVIRLHQPPAIRLLDTNTHKASLSHSITPHLGARENTPVVGLGRPSSAQNPDFLAALSLSSKPVMTPAGPVFGLPSLSATTSTPNPREHDVDEMDWTPTDISKSPADDASWLRPQRFFPPEKATGLEGLFERTLLVVDDSPFGSGEQKNPTSFLNHIRTWWWAYVVFLVPMCAIVYQVQETRRLRSRPLGPEPF
ncbi:hypothetical protein H2248_001026 [Termitomyces sp. 'cryptogamus']|nr:hypothetical protein H2248_001026 [Termitomyces sp. 'cryptogamus']